MKKAIQNSAEPIEKGRPALTPEAREQQLIALAVDLVEKRLREGTASSQETTHFLKLGSSKSQLEKDKLRYETELVKAKTESIQSQQHIEELYNNAIAALKGYKGESEEDD